MRFLSAIIAIWIACMSVLPCMDNIGAEQCGEQTHFHAADSHEHDNEDSHDDLCSPFCVCHCCHAHSLIASVDNSFNQVADTEQHNGYLQSVPQARHYDIFHPPKQA